MGGILYADTFRLEQHRALLEKARDTAGLLAEQLSRARRLVPEGERWRYDRLIGQAETLERYFRGMAEQVDRAGFELAKLSLEIQMLLRKD